MIGHIFARSSRYEAHSLGRILIWGWAIGFALLAIAVASRQLRIKPNNERQESADETTALLSGDNVEVPSAPG